MIKIKVVVILMVAIMGITAVPGPMSRFSTS